MAVIFSIWLVGTQRHLLILIISYLSFIQNLAAMPERNEKKITLNFFQLNPEIESLNEEEKKEQISQIESIFDNIPDKLVSIELSDSTIELYGTIEKRNSFFLGTFVRAQTRDIPPGINLENAQLTPLPLSENQGLGFPTCFLYDPSLRIVMIESATRTIGMGVFCNFIEQNFSVPSLSPSFVINPKKLAEYNKMTLITKLQVKVAKLEHGTIFNTSKKKAVGQIIHSADNTNTDGLEYKIFKRGKGKSLTRSLIREAVRELLKFKETNEVKKLIVSGKEDDESPTNTVDFLIQKMKDSINVKQRRLVESFEINEHYKKMIEVYKTHQSNLSIYKTPKK